jgi:cytosine/adenosine deaminase-related metal-dependent hydrolase
MQTNHEPWTLTAHWILPIDGPPIERGTVTIQGERILAVESHGIRTVHIDLGNAAALPGLVNAHTHLDLSGFRGRVPGSQEFVDWLQSVIAHRRGRTPADAVASVRSGLAESLRYGTTLIGDISAQGLSWPILVESPIRAVVFYELLGLTKVRAQQSWSGACAWITSHPPLPNCRPGLSPHAPYSVRASLFRAATRLAHERGLLVSTHLAETRAELELLSTNGGPFARFLGELAVWDPDGFVHDITDVLALADVAPLVISHANYLDIGRSLPAGIRVVYCPRTQHAFGHPPHPFRELLAKGVTVALGTDSLASNPDLDVLGEARFLHRQYPEFPAHMLLRMATLAGAEALDWQVETGSLTVGKSADLIVVPLPGRGHGTPEELVLESAAPVEHVLCRGKWIYGRAAQP